MMFVQTHAPLCGLGLAPPQPAVPISGFFLAGHVPGNFGLGVPVRVLKPRLVEDADVFLADWGEPITIDGVDAGEGIFSDGYASDTLGTVGMATSGPRLLMPSANLPERDPDDPTDPVLELTDRKGFYDRRGQPKPFRYVVREVQPDGLLMSTLILARHPDQTSQ